MSKWLNLIKQIAIIVIAAATGAVTWPIAAGQVCTTVALEVVGQTEPAAAIQPVSSNIPLQTPAPNTGIADIVQGLSKVINTK